MNYNDQLVHLKNRVDIDGLRGLSILLVLFFHAFPNVVPGGFTGVDVFFVISGFLISNIIYKSLEEDKFSFITFYIRRIKRLFPALILMMLLFYGIGWFMLINKEFLELGKQLIASAGFMNNLLLLRQSASYFGGEMLNNPLLQPLLHLWSLGVEEQFYLIWPPLLWLTWKRRLTFTLIVSILIGSFILNIHWSNTNPVYAFYSPLSRFWEPLVGAFLAYVTLPKRHPLVRWRFLYKMPVIHAMSSISHDHHRLINHLFSISGLILIFTAAFTLSKQSTFPGWLALLPTLGAAFLMKAGPLSLANKAILSLRPMVWFGKISYPLYLWHWPILSFTYIYHLEPLSTVQSCVCILISILLAWLTYEYIEKPIRFGSKRVYVPVALCSMMAGIGAIGFFTYHFNGFANRFPEVFKSQDIDKEWRTGNCFLNLQNNQHAFTQNNCIAKGDKEMILLWGDSFAAALYPGLKRLQEMEHIGLAQFTISACPPIINYDISSNTECKAMNNTILHTTEKIKPDIVLLHSTWGYQGDSFELLKKTILTLRKNGAKRVVILGSTPNRNLSLQSILFHRYFIKDPTNLPEYLNDNILPIFYKTEPIVRQIAKETGAEYISAYDKMCNKQGCISLINNGDGRAVTSYDGGHLSPEGAIWLVHKIKDQLLNPK